jgi:hypothetical protein
MISNNTTFQKKIIVSVLESCRCIQVSIFENRNKTEACIT